MPRAKSSGFFGVRTRFRRRVRVSKNLYVNVGKRGVTGVRYNPGGSPFSISFNHARQIVLNLRIPGTGLSFSRPFSCCLFSSAGLLLLSLTAYCITTKVWTYSNSIKGSDTYA